MKFEREDLTVLEMASGHSLAIPIFRFKGEDPGPHVYIQSSVHAAEVQGNPVIYFLIKQLQNLKLAGSVTLVPHCNPLGTNMKIGEYTYGRFDPVTGANFNRLYWNATCDDEKSRTDPFQINLEEYIKTNSEVNFREKLLEQIEKYHQSKDLQYGENLALILQKMAFEADIVLDLHCDSVSLPYIYTPSYALDSAKDLNFDYHLVIENKFGGALDEASFCPWWSLAKALNKLPNFEAFTLELGSKESISFEAANIISQKILAFLAKKEIIVDGNFISESGKQYACKAENFQVFRAPYGGLYDYVANLGKAIGKDDILAKCLQINQQKFENSLIEIPSEKNCIPITHCGSAIAHQHMEIMKLFVDYWEI